MLRLGGGGRLDRVPDLGDGNRVSGADQMGARFRKSGRGGGRVGEVEKVGEVAV